VPPSSAQAPVVLAKLPSSAASSLAIDAMALYVPSYEVGPVYRVPLDGSAPVVLDDLNTLVVAVDATRVYSGSSFAATSQGLVVACEKTGCGGQYTTLASGQGGVQAIAVDEGTVYWGGSAGVMKLSLTGGTPTPVATGISVWNLVATGGTVFVSATTPANNTAALMSMPAAGGTPTVRFASCSGSVSALATDGVNVYYGTTDGTVGSIPVAGGPATTLGQTARGVTDLASDGTTVYFTVTDTPVYSVPIAGGPVSTIADCQSNPTAIAVDSHAVYWANAGDGTVMKLAK
jgi:hypothetical protein